MANQHTLTIPLSQATERQLLVHIASRMENAVSEAAPDTARLAPPRESPRTPTPRRRGGHRMPEHRVPNGLQNLRRGFDSSRACQPANNGKGAKT